MTEAYSVLSAIYETLRNDTDLMNLTDKIFVGSQVPQAHSHPAVYIWVRTVTERTGLGVLADIVIDVVIRSKSGDGDGTELAQIFERVDAIINNKYFKRGTGSGTVTRAGLPVHYGMFDEQLKDYFKRCRYRMILKRNSI